LEPPSCVVSSWVIKRVYTILIWNTISGSSNLDNCFILVLSLFNPYINITSKKFSSTPFHLLFIILYSSPPCSSTSALTGYLLLRYSCTWDKTSIFWSYHSSQMNRSHHVMDLLDNNCVAQFTYKSSGILIWIIVFFILLIYLPTIYISCFPI